MRILKQLLLTGLLVGCVGGAAAQDMPTFKTTYSRDAGLHLSWAGTRQDDGAQFRMDIYIAKSPDEAQKVAGNLTTSQNVPGQVKFVGISTITGRKIGDTYWTSAKSSSTMKGAESVVIRRGTFAYRASISKVERKAKADAVSKPITKHDMQILENLISDAMNDPQHPFPNR